MKKTTKNEKMYKIKKNPTRLISGAFLPSLMIFSLLGFGFSAWVIKDNASNVQVDGNVGIVFEGSRYVDYNSIQLFQYCKQGIIDDGAIVYEADIAVSFNVAVAGDLYDSLINKNGFNLTADFFCRDNSDLFSFMGEVPQVEFQYAILGGDSGSGTTTSMYLTDGTATTGIESTILFDNKKDLSSVKDVTFTVKYKLDFSAYESNFETEVYPKLYKNTTFSYSVTVSDLGGAQ